MSQNTYTQLIYHFLWSTKDLQGYGEFSKSLWQMKVVYRYIQNQEEHDKGGRNRDEYGFLSIILETAVRSGK